MGADYAKLWGAHGDFMHFPGEPAPLLSDFYRRRFRPPAVLEIGCGTGRNLAWFASQGWEVFGIDVSAGDLETARVQMVVSGAKGSLILGDCTKELPVRDASMMAVLDCSTIQHLLAEGREAVAKEVGRVLMPRGWLLSLCEGWQEGIKGTETEHGTFADFPEGTPWFQYPPTHFFKEEELRVLWEVVAGLKIERLAGDRYPARPGMRERWVVEALKPRRESGT